MILILEGINKVGKTSIAEKLSSDYGFDSIRMFNKQIPEQTLFQLASELNSFGMPINDFYEDIIMAEFLSQISKDIAIVFDRSVASSDVYRILNGQKPVSDKILEWWYGKLKLLNATYVWVHTDYESISERTNDSDLFKVNPETYIILEKEFTRHFHLSKKYDVRSYLIRPKQNSLEEVTSKVIETLRR